MKIPQCPPEAYLDFVRLAKAKTYANTTDLYKAFHEWVKDVYGPRAISINNKAYPPGTTATAPFPGSFLWDGSTPSQRRYIKRYGRTDFILSAAYDFPLSFDGTDPDERQLALKVVEELKTERAA